jgi:hypothetical protein
MRPPGITPAAGSPFFSAASLKIADSTLKGRGFKPRRKGLIDSTTALAATSVVTFLHGSQIIMSLLIMDLN